MDIWLISHTTIYSHKIERENYPTKRRWVPLEIIARFLMVSTHKKKGNRVINLSKSIRLVKVGTADIHMEILRLLHSHHSLA